MSGTEAVSQLLQPRVFFYPLFTEHVMELSCLKRMLTETNSLQTAETQSESLGYERVWEARLLEKSLTAE